VLIIQIVFIGLLILAFISIKRVWPTHELDSNSRRETQAGFVLSRPFFASLLIGIIISLFFYSNRPLVVGTIFLILLMISTLVLLPGLLSKSIRKPLIVLFCLIVLDVFQDFLPYQSLLNRALIFLQCLAILGLIYFVWKNRKEFSLKQVSARIISGLLGIFGVLMIIAFIANVLGLVKLSDFLISSTFGTLSFSAIVITMVIILNSLIIILIKGKKAESIPLYKQLKIFIDRRIRPIINWSAFALWFFAALTSFRLLNPVRNAIKAIMETKFSIASVEIFIGGIFSFILIVFFTYVLVRFVKNILKDDWVSKSRLPRGTADAMSMLIRYTIVAFGVYLALNSLGLNLNKIGFLAGALGVGIGFGLQTVVLNFLAGLILSLEQPIHVGDIIEVEQEMGKVTQIGVRASKVLTWNGSEAIIPNGILVSKKVTNWTLADDKRRLVISVKTPFTADPEEVIKILTEVAGRHPKSFDQPGPLAVFNGYESHALDFTLYCWVQFGDSLTSKSEIAVGAFKALAKAGIEAPVPIQKINLEKPDGEK
jgi:small-conductance mechanosensitive channel